MHGHLGISVDIISAERYEIGQHFIIYFPNIKSFEMCQRSLMLRKQLTHYYKHCCVCFHLYIAMSKRENQGKGEFVTTRLTH